MHYQQQENESSVVHTSSIVEPETTLFAQVASPISAIQEEKITFPELLTQTKQEVSKWRKRRRRTLGISAVLFPLSILCLNLMALVPRHSTFMLPLFLLNFLMLIGSLFGLLAGILMRPLGKNPIYQLWQSEDIKAVGPLLESTQMLLPEVTPKAVNGLVRLLPQMQASDAALLTNYHRDCLRRLLGASPIDQPHYPSRSLEGIPSQQIETMQNFYEGRIHQQRELALAILWVFEYIGGGKEIAIVQKLAAGEGLARNDKEIEAAAQNCLPILQTRIAEERSSLTYLRAADAPPAMPSKVLLRPAEGAGEAHSQQLLRANPAKETEQ